MSSPALIGTWNLVSFVRWADGARVGDVLGPHPAGRLTYGADGRVTALLMRRDRLWTAGARFTAVDDGTRGRAALGFVSYAGRFEVQGDRVIHHVEIALYPEQVGTELVRSWRFVGDELVLRTGSERTRSGRARSDELTWHRA